MSCFIHNIEVYQKINKKLILLFLDPNYKCCIFLRTFNLPYNSSIETIGETINDFVNGIYKQNIKAYNSRYNEKNRFEKINFKSCNFINISDIQLIKYLRSVLYQCSESQKKSKYFIQLKKLIDNLQYTFIGMLDCYDKASWN